MASRQARAPLRVAVVAACPFPERRGTPVRIQRLAEGIQRRGHQVHVVTYPYGNGALAAPLKLHRVHAAGTSYRPAPGPSASKLLVTDPLLVLLLRRVLRREQIDLVHAHHYEGLLAARLAGAGRSIPVVYDAHTLLESELPSYGRGLPSGIKRALGGGLDRRLPPMADHVIAVSDRIRDRLLAATSLRPEEVTAISNGVECDLFDLPRPATAAERGPVVVFTGNLAPYQGIDLLLEAFRLVLAARPDARLRLVTESDFAHYEPHARTLGIRGAIDVVRAGFDQVPALLADADVAVNPRVNCDGIPLKLLNYMAASKPVVSFEGSAPGVEHGRTGWLVTPGDVDGFARAVVSLLNSPELALEMGQHARAHVVAEHSWDAVAQRTEAVYYQVLGRGPTRRIRRSGRTAPRPVPGLAEPEPKPVPPVPAPLG